MAISEIAYLSTADKAGVGEFAEGLQRHGFELYAGGGTEQVISKTGVFVKGGSLDLIGEGRVFNTDVEYLPRATQANLLAAALQELPRQGIPHIDLVCVNLVPIHGTMDQTNGHSTAGLQNSLEGVAILAGAVAGNKLVVTEPNQYDDVIDWLDRGRTQETTFRRQLAAAAMLTIADYTSSISEVLEPPVQPTIRLQHHPVPFVEKHVTK